MMATAVVLSSCASFPRFKPTPDVDYATTTTYVLIKSGTFLMGSPEGELHAKDDERPQTKVTITRDFRMAATPVTVGQFDGFVRATGYQTVSEREGWSHYYTPDGIEERVGMTWRDPGFAQDKDHPVVNVGWEDVQAYCAFLTETTGKTVRLPTEAEWEYACRAGTTTAYWWGDKGEDGAGRANFFDITAASVINDGREADFPFEDGYVYTSPVATFEPNPWGLYDMHGNVWEWCSDLYPGPHPGGALVDPKGASEGEYHIRRGGSWYPGPGTARSANRGRSRNDFRVNNRGFRVVMEVEE
jgi:formylglycine-generating enzyme required for sulfatase activity